MSGQDPAFKDTGSGFPRRSFLKRSLAAAALAFPALGTLATAQPAYAGHRHCQPGIFYVRTLGCDCFAGRFICTYQRTCSVCGQSCGQFVKDVGPC